MIGSDENRITITYEKYQNETSLIIAKDDKVKIHSGCWNRKLIRVYKIWSNDYSKVWEDKCANTHR